ncbi:hypothetical protein [Streptomyces swartbergensis]|uniref:hypothetical protein n=1 Tax=Streptomyces swartbergensis TaxID=487165 RepID=UPI0013029B70|nr:hypothetical protein [Streptomyces swartbergensis]
MEITATLRPMLDSLAKEDGVFSRVERTDADTVEEHVYGLVLEAQEAWAPYAVAGAQGPTTPAGVGEALEEHHCGPSRGRHDVSVCAGSGLHGPDAS